MQQQSSRGPYPSRRTVLAGVLASAVAAGCHSDTTTVADSPTTSSNDVSDRSRWRLLPDVPAADDMVGSVSLIGAGDLVVSAVRIGYHVEPGTGATFDVVAVSALRPGDDEWTPLPNASSMTDEVFWVAPAGRHVVVATATDAAGNTTCWLVDPATGERRALGFPDWGEYSILGADDRRILAWDGHDPSRLVSVDLATLEQSPTPPSPPHTIWTDFVEGRLVGWISTSPPFDSSDSIPDDDVVLTSAFASADPDSDVALTTPGPDLPARQYRYSYVGNGYELHDVADGLVLMTPDVPRRAFHYRAASNDIETIELPFEPAAPIVGACSLLLGVDTEQRVRARRLDGHEWSTIDPPIGAVPGTPWVHGTVGDRVLVTLGQGRESRAQHWLLDPGTPT